MDKICVSNLLLSKYMKMHLFSLIELALVSGWVRALGSTRPEKLPTFSEVQQLRRKQAKRSLLVQVSSLKSSDLLGSYLEQYGTIKSLYHYTTDKKVGG